MIRRELKVNILLIHRYLRTAYVAQAVSAMDEVSALAENGSAVLVPHIFFFNGSRSANAASRLPLFAAKASAICAGENMPTCQTAM